MSEFKIIKAEDAVQANKGNRKSPAQMILESLPEGYYTYDDMAKRYDVHKETMRRLCKAVKNDGTSKVNAPSQAVQQGGMTMYLFTKADVAELDEYFAKRGIKPSK